MPRLSLDHARCSGSRQSLKSVDQKPPFSHRLSRPRSTAERATRFELVLVLPLAIRIPVYHVVVARFVPTTPNDRARDCARRSDDTDARMMPHATREKSSSHQSTSGTGGGARSVGMLITPTVSLLAAPSSVANRFPRVPRRSSIKRTFALRCQAVKRTTKILTDAYGEVL
jgi:hypothetical protein